MEAISASLPAVPAQSSSGQVATNLPRKAIEARARTITDAFEEYRELEYQFGRVPGIGPKIQKHVERQKQQPEYAAVLNEPEASGLIQLAKEMEDKGQLCCAYYVYEQAKSIPHAPSAKFAGNRYDALSRDPEVVASAEACAELQWCQTAFDRARQSLTTDPKNSKSLFRQIVKRAPPDSDVFKQAAMRLGN